MNQLDPVAGQWYVRPDGLKFEIIDIDDEGVIEIQNQDGTLDEIDADDWRNITVDVAEQSEDPNAPFDNVPIPDEADGGDPVDIESVTFETQRVSFDEQVSPGDAIGASEDNIDDTDEE